MLSCLANLSNDEVFTPLKLETELTAHLTRRSVYCSKHAKGKYSACTVFDDDAGNIRYEFVHAENIEGLFNMKFDVIVGNPPYQMSTGGSGRQAKPVYQYFVRQAKKMKPRYLTMIIPSRWFAGGMGLNEFRGEMLKDKHIRKMVDYPNAKDCFSSISASGGINYFLWDRDKTSEHAGEADKNGQFRVISKAVTLGPNEACTHSYIIIGEFEHQHEAENLNNYLQTRFSRFLLLQAISSIHLTKEKFIFVPMQDFTEPWTDEKLYGKYGITKDEQAFIESMIRPMEGGNGTD